MKITFKPCWIFVLSLVFVVAESRLVSMATSSEVEDEGFIRIKTSDLLGGLREYKGEGKNNGEIEGIGRFAVQEHNKKENALLEFGRVIKAKEQVVSGMMYHLTLEAIDAGKKKIYEAKVWVKPWLNFKQLQEFRHTTDVPSFTSSDLGVKQDSHELGWQTVSTYEPIVLDAAHYAVKIINQMSNSINSLIVSEILHAKAKVTENDVKFDLLLKTKRGTREEIFKVMVGRSIEGKFYLHHWNNSLM